MGGYGWRLLIHPESPIYDDDTANNALEFLGIAITLWLSIKECESLGLTDELILVLSDSTSAISWIHNSSRLDNNSHYKSTITFIARKIAEVVLSSKNFIVSQHLPGTKNVISDWLSYEGEERSVQGEVKENPIAFDCPPNDVVTHRILTSFPQLVPQGFKVCHLPPEILSFAQLAVQILESSTIRKRKTQQKDMTATGGAGAHSATMYCVGKTPPLREYRKKSIGSSLSPSSRFTGDPNLLRQERLLGHVSATWRGALSKKPHGLYLRRSTTVSGTAPFTSVETDPEICFLNYEDY